MKNANLFQLGIGLETGAHAEDISRGVIDSAPMLELVTDNDRDDHFIRKDGAVFAGTHLIIEVEHGTGLDDETLIQNAIKKNQKMTM